MSESGLTVAVTGAAGYVGSRLISQLCEDERVGRVLAFDVRTPELRHPKLVADTVDVRDANLARRLEGCDVVVHLAFIMNPIKDDALMRAVNVDGSQNVFNAAAEAGVGKIIYTSSGVVYGAHPDNDVPLTEESPLRANLDFSYAAHKLEVEYVVKEFRREHPSVTFTVFRPAIVLGPHADSAWSHFLELPVLVGVRGYSPPFQFVHEQDVAAALRHAVFFDLDGAYNLTPRGWLEQEEILEIVGRRKVELSEPAAFALMEKLWDLGLAEAPAAMLHYVMYPWVMSPDRLEAAGFVCSHSNADSVSELAARVAGYVRLGRRRVRRSHLTRGAAAGAGVLLALALAGATRRSAA